MNKILLLIIILFAANVNSTKIENVLACENEKKSQIEVVKKFNPDIQLLHMLAVTLKDGLS